MLTVNKDTNLNNQYILLDFIVLLHNVSVSFSKTRYRQCMVYGAKAIHCNSKNDIKDLIFISVSEMSHLCPLQVLNISNAHAHLTYNTVHDSC